MPFEREMFETHIPVYQILYTKHTFRIRSIPLRLSPPRKALQPPKSKVTSDHPAEIYKEFTFTICRSRIHKCLIQDATSDIFVMQTSMFSSHLP